MLFRPTGLQSSGLTVLSSVLSFANPDYTLTSNACLVESTAHAIRASLFASAVSVAENPLLFAAEDIV